MALIIAGLVAFGVTVALVRYVLLAPSVRQRILAEPSDSRWHRTPTPSFGGVPMFLGVLFAVGVSSAVGDRLTLAVVAGAATLFVVGSLDDRLDLKPRAKLLGQAIGAALVVAIGSGDIGMSLLGGLVFMAWMVLMANSVNLLDNMDGLAAGTSLVSLLIMLPIVVTSGQTGLALVVIATAGSAAGFLVFNASPAKVFMGDSGSMWLGLVLATTVVLADYGGRAFAPLAAMTVMAVPMLDTATVIYSRLRGGRPIMTGGRDHLSHRLVRLGLSDRQAVLGLSLAAAISGLIGVGRVFLDTAVWVSLVAAVWVGLVLLVARLLRVPVYQTSQSQ